MAKRSYRVDLDLNQNELLRAKIQNLAAAPTSPTPVVGQIYYDTVKDQLGIYTSTGWSYGGDITNVVGTGSTGIQVSVDGAGVATVSLLAASGSQNGYMSSTDKSKLDASTASATNSTLMQRDGSGNTAVNMITINNAPTAATDGANKAYVDSVAQGLDVKPSVRAATTASITLSAPQTIDGIAVIAGNRVLVKDQSTASQNGVYIVAAGAWTRATDFATGSSAAGAFMFVEEGTTNADTGWVCTNNVGSDVVNTANLAFSQFSGAGSIIAGFGLTKTGNTIDFVAADNSLTVNADSVAVKLATTGAIETLAGGLSAKVDTTYVTKDGSNQLTIGAGVAKIGTKSITIGLAAGAQTITHNFGTRNVNVIVYDATTYEELVVEVINTTTNTVTVTGNGSNTTAIAVVIGNTGTALS